MEPRLSAIAFLLLLCAVGGAAGQTSRAGFPPDFTLAWSGDVHVGLADTVAALANPKSYPSELMEHICPWHPLGLASLSIVMEFHKADGRSPSFLADDGRLYLLIPSMSKAADIPAILRREFKVAASIWKDCHEQIIRTKRESWRGVDYHEGHCHFLPGAQPPPRAVDALERAQAPATDADSAMPPAKDFEPPGLSREEAAMLALIRESGHVSSTFSTETLIGVLRALEPDVTIGHGPYGRGIMMPNDGHRSLTGAGRVIIREISKRYRADAAQSLDGERENIARGKWRVYCWDDAAGVYSLEREVAENLLDEDSDRTQREKMSNYCVRLSGPIHPVNIPIDFGAPK